MSTGRSRPPADPRQAPEAPDEALQALDEVVAGLEQVVVDCQRALQRAQHIRERRTSGVSWRDIVTQEQRPLMVELMSDALDVLLGSGSRWRREEARALHAEGVTMDRIATLFGVTRQRVSQLLRERPGAAGAGDAGRL